MKKSALISFLFTFFFLPKQFSKSELGASAGIAYDTSFNPAGLRLCFRGVSQSLPSYVRRFCRRLVQHHVKILEGSSKISETVYQKALLDVRSTMKVNMLNRETASSSPRQIPDQEVANQGSYFLKCTTGAVMITQGDILPKEGNKLLDEVRTIFRDYGKGALYYDANPNLRDLLYTPYWRPRDASPCLLPGVHLISEACGRVPR